MRGSRCPAQADLDGLRDHVADAEQHARGERVGDDELFAIGALYGAPCLGHSMVDSHDVLVLYLDYYSNNSY